MSEVTDTLICTARFRGYEAVEVGNLPEWRDDVEAVCVAGEIVTTTAVERGGSVDDQIAMIALKLKRFPSKRVA